MKKERGYVMTGIIFIIVLFFLIKAGYDILFDIFFGGKR